VRLDAGLRQRLASRDAARASHGRPRPARDDQAEEEPGKVEPWKLYPSIIPSVGYTPQNGFVFGSRASPASTSAIRAPRRSRTSRSSALYTSKNQVILQSRNTAILEGNAWQLQGDYRFFITNQPTYGLGSGRESEFGVSIGAPARRPRSRARRTWTSTSSGSTSSC